MEEKLKTANAGSGDLEACWFHRYQELQAAMQEKEDASAELEQQLQEQVEQIHTCEELHHSSRRPQAELVQSVPCSRAPQQCSSPATWP